MKKISACKRVLTALVAIALICSCALTSLAGNMTAFRGDSGKGKQQIKMTTNGSVIYYEMRNIGYSGSTPNMYMGTNAVGEKITMRVEDDNPTRTFMYWSDMYSNRIYSYDRSLSFTVASRMNLRATCAVVSDDPANKQHFVTYVNYGGTELLNEDSMYPCGQMVTQPAPGSLPGFTFERWSMTREEVAASEDNLVVYPIYRVNDESYTVQITNEDYVSGAGTYSNFQTVNLKAEPVNGKGEAFSYWKDSDGKIISYDRNYSFRINYDTTLTAVYGETVTAEPVIRISKIVRDTDDFKLTFYAERSVPEGYTVVSHGILMSTNAAQTQTAMVLSAAGETQSSAVRKGYGRSNESNGTYSLAKANTGPTTLVSARPFVIVENASGAQFLVYGDMVSAYNA